jgi:hypothetical protein
MVGAKMVLQRNTDGQNKTAILPCTFNMKFSDLDRMQGSVNFQSCLKQGYKLFQVVYTICNYSLYTYFRRKMHVGCIAQNINLLPSRLDSILALISYLPLNSETLK